MPLTAKEKRELEYIYRSERKRGYSKERSRRIARAVVYSRKRHSESGSRELGSHISKNLGRNVRESGKLGKRISRNVEEF